MCLLLGLFDFSNVFQNALVPINRQILVTTPPKFIPWFKWRYPDYKVKPSTSGKYATQIIRGIQGDCKIGCLWFILLCSILKAFDMKQCLRDMHTYGRCT